MTRAAIYTRISTSGQEDGTSLDTHEDACRAHAERNGYEVVTAYQELLDTGLLMTGAGEDEAGNVYFTSCLCGYGQNAPHREGAVWMLVSADQVPEGATTAPPDRSAGESTPAASEGISSPEAATPEN